MLVVLWAIVVMSFVVIGFIEFARYGIDKEVAEAKAFRALHLAESGIVLAKHPGVRRGDPLLNQEFSENMALDVRVTTEGARINLNTLGNSALHKVTRDLFFRWGMDMESAVIICDSLADWVDGDDVPRVQGAEEEYYTLLGHKQYPRNAKFVSIDESLLVRGMDKLERIKPDWRRFFTVVGDGKIDVNEASGELLEVMLDGDPEAVARILEYRRGEDLIEYTEDDTLFSDLEVLREVMVVPRDKFRPFSALITFNHPVRRIESRARVGDVVKTLVLIEGGGYRQQTER